MNCHIQILSCNFYTPICAIQLQAVKICDPSSPRCIRSAFTVMLRSLPLMHKTVRLILIYTSNKKETRLAQNPGKFRNNDNAKNNITAV